MLLANRVTPSPKLPPDRFIQNQPVEQANLRRVQPRNLTSSLAKRITAEAPHRLILQPKGKPRRGAIALKFNQTISYERTFEHHGWWEQRRAISIRLDG
jgi:hypothetical protein